jgi:hypothetical protein
MLQMPHRSEPAVNDLLLESIAHNRDYGSLAYLRAARGTGHAVCAGEYVAPAFSQSVVTERAQGELAPQVCAIDSMRT